MQALEVAGKVTLVFTKVTDELFHGLVDEDEEADAFPADRSYWEEKASKATLVIVDNVLEIAGERRDEPLQYFCLEHACAVS